MKKLFTLVGLVSLLLLCMRWGSAVPQDLDPLKVASDTHKLLFENRFVRVLEVHVPPGKTEPWHQHGNRVVVYLSDYHTRITERGGQPQENLRKAGLARWSEPTIHQVENIGKTEGRVISVELK
ncbi:MAG: cytoplasmic protein [Acidobacteria bacterium]|nr:cytoplasmic protein [Acidobacteriota bacterium]MBI3425963.1 cytoplasmic protein [Acidobacteriota bacterium]